MKNKYARVLLLFLAIMAGLTVVSRAADSITVAKVEVSMPKRGMLSQEAFCDGVIEASDKIYVEGASDLRLLKVIAGEGQKLEAGDPVLAFDPREIEEKIAEVRKTIAALSAQMGGTDGSAAAKAAVRAAEQNLERALADDAFETELNGGKQLLKNKREVEDARLQLETAREQLDESVAGVSALEAEINCEKQKKQLALLEEVREGGGIVTAKEGGFLGEVLADVGEKTEDGVLYTVVPEDAGYEFSGKLSEDEGKYIQTGDEVSVTPFGKATPLGGSLSVKSVEREEDGGVGIRIDIPAGKEIWSGMGASMSHVKKTKQYETTVPLSALRGTEAEAYIFIVSEKSTVLGKRETAEKVLVKVLNKDKKWAALEGGLPSDSRIIVNTSKPVFFGDRVRLGESDG